MKPCRFLASTKQGLVEMEVSSETGEVINQHITKIESSVAFLCATLKGKFIYACSTGPEVEGNTGYLLAFARGEPLSELKSLQGQPTQGVTACHASLHFTGKLVSVSNFRGSGGKDSQGSISLLPVAADGGLLPVAANILFPGEGPKKPRQAASHPHSSVFTTSPDTLRVADLGTDSLWSVHINITDPLDDKNLAGEPHRYASADGSGPRHVTSIMNGHALFIVHEMDNSLTWFHPNTGIRLKMVANVPMVTQGTQAAAADVHVSPDNRFVYASLRGSDEIVCFPIDLEAQTIGNPARFPSGGNGPRSFAISNDGALLVVSNTGSDSTNVFRRDMETGELTAVAAALPGCSHVIALPD